MSRIFALTLTLAVLLPATMFNHSPSRSALQDNRKFRPAEVFNVPGMPVKISAPEIEEGGIIYSDINYTLTNIQDETVKSVSLLALVFSKNNKYIRTDDTRSGEDLAPYASQEMSGSHLEKLTRPGERVIFAVSEVVSEKGTWETDTDKLEEDVKAWVEGKFFTAINVQHDENLILTDKDKGELYQRTLESLLGDEHLTKYLSMAETKEIILSTQDIEPKFTPWIKGVKITVMTPAEIAEKRKLEGVFGFLHFYPITVEGTRAYVRILYRKDIQQTRDSFIPCCGGVSFVYRKLDGKWVGEYSRGYRI